MLHVKPSVLPRHRHVKLLQKSECNIIQNPGFDEVYHIHLLWCEVHTQRSSTYKGEKCIIIIIIIILVLHHGEVYIID